MNYKYVVGKIVSGSTPILGAIVFPELMNHSHMARVFFNLPGQETGVVSAGFFQVTPGGNVVPYGESVSLSLKSRPEDAVLIAKSIGLFSETDEF